MKRRSRGNTFDISIRGDELEHHRIQLEHNLQNTELSFRLSSTSDDENDDGYDVHRHSRHQHHHHDSSVEYPRHLSEPSLPEFPSFAHRSRDHFGDEDQSHVRGWSYRTGDDEEGIHPYGGETVSTAAHHASALTISAGLGGGRAARRDPSLSGAEYDPDRPLHEMIAGVNSKHSMFDLDPSKHQAIGSMTYDPVVVDSTAELDRLLESGHAPPPSMRSRSVRLTSPISSATSSASDSEAPREQGQPSRPKLTDHLRHVSFSPKRPRSAQGNPSNPSSPLTRPSRNVEDNNASMNMPTPRPARRSNIFPSYSSPAQPEVRLHPATPSTTGSKFTRMARGINKEIEVTQQQLTSSRQAAASASTRPASAPIERNPFHDVADPEPAPSFRNPTPRKRSFRDTTKGNIQLPDVTGLTAAVESPAKPGAQYYPYRANDRPRDSEARLLQTLSTVQSQLRGLEEENGISRRRVRELEMELEECKREVTRERTRLIEREELNSRLHNDTSYRAGSKGKAKAREGPPEIDDERLHARYKEAVDEKKALEALINSLRSHLTRLTSELASHQELLTELRNLRESDAQALREKGTEIIQLKEEVQRLAGEVEVLRGVVEEGLKERRASREIQVEESAADLAMSQDLDEEESENEDQPEPDDEESHDDDEEDEEEEAEPFDPASIQEASSRVNQADKTMRTDFATLGSTNLGDSQNASGGGTRFVDEEELDRIAAEVEERRSNRSNGSIASQTQRARSPSPMRRNRRATVEDVEEDESRQIPRHSRHQQYRPDAQPQTQAQPEPSTSRPSAPTPVQATRHYDRDGLPREREHHHQAEPETPFPQIRGEQLERLFFSAPEHNAKTCTVCYRRRNRPNTSSPSWSRPKAGANVRQAEAADVEEDEGYEGSEGADGGERAAGPGGSKGKQREREHITFSEDPAHWRQAGRKQGLPPQTVVARVIRELEDDFTHYKSVYVELADQYKDMDAVSDVPRRNMLAQHLREVVDVLEQKGDQIASLYDLLSFKDKPVSESIVPEKGRTTTTGAASWGQSDRRRGTS